MRFGKAEARLFLKGLGVSLVALLGLLSLMSAASALTWQEIDQQLTRCVKLTEEAKTLLDSAKNIKDSESKRIKKRIVALENKKPGYKVTQVFNIGAIKKAEDKLRQVVKIFQTLEQAEFPPEKFSSRDIKSSISGNLVEAKQCQELAQTLSEIAKKEGLSFTWGVVMVKLSGELNSMRFKTLFSQAELAGIVAGEEAYRKRIN